MYVVLLQLCILHITQVAESCGQIVPGEHSSTEFLFALTTRDFEKLPLQFRVGVCACVCVCVWVSNFAIV